MGVTVSWMGQFDAKAPMKKVAASKQYVIYHRDYFLEDFDGIQIGCCDCEDSGEYAAIANEMKRSSFATT